MLNGLRCLDFIQEGLQLVLPLKTDRSQGKLDGILRLIDRIDGFVDQPECAVTEYVLQSQRLRSMRAGNKRPREGKVHGVPPDDQVTEQKGDGQELTHGNTFYGRILPSPSALLGKTLPPSAR